MGKCKSDYGINNEDNKDGRQNESELIWNEEATLGRCRRLRLRTCCPVEQLPHIARRCVGRLLRLNKQASSIEILKVAVVLGVLKCHLQVFLHFRNFLKIIWHLKALHVLNNSS